MITCQLTYLPFSTEQIANEVNEVIDFIDNYEVEYRVGDLSTTVKGEKDEVLRLVRDLYEAFDEAGKVFRLHIELLSSGGYD